MIRRQITKKLFSATQKFQIVAVFGPRQAGKTTLAKSTFPEFVYKNLEDPTEREYALSDPKSFLSDIGKGMIIDEIQRVPELFSYIQVIVDSNPTAQFIITGSQNYLLLENISQTLAGRVFLLRLLPFSLEEIKPVYEPINYGELIFRGFFPPIYDRNIPVIDWMPSYIQTYLERDVRQVKNISNLNLFSKFLQLCSGRTGQILNISSLSNEVGVSDNTIRSWLSVLETGYTIYFLKPYFKNFNKRLVKAPKLYFIDTGLASSLLNIRSSEQIESHFLKGGLFENMVILEFIKYFNNRGEKPELFYWRDNHGNEIDLIFEKDNCIYAIEIKASRTISGSFFKGLSFFKKLVGDINLKKFVVFGGDQFQKRKEGTVISWRELDRIFEN